MNTLTRIATALYGPAFKPALADALGVGLRTVQRWCAGDEPVPEGVWADLAAVVDEELDALLAARAALDLRTSAPPSGPCRRGAPAGRA